MHEELSLSEIKKEWHGSIRSYEIGFIASLLLTTLAFLLVLSKALTGPPLVYSLIGLALTQAIIQMLFFLHLGQEARPRWETMVFLFMVLLLLIIVLGSLWIMYDLNDRVMSGMGHD
jgi:cytochrome o ubiquinol oxidase operon protein cyoD